MLGSIPNFPQRWISRFRPRVRAVGSLARHGPQDRCEVKGLGAGLGDSGDGIIVLQTVRPAVFEARSRPPHPPSDPSAL